MLIMRRQNITICKSAFDSHLYCIIFIYKPRNENEFNNCEKYFTIFETVLRQLRQLSPK